LFYYLIPTSFENVGLYLGMYKLDSQPPLSRVTFQLVSHLMLGVTHLTHSGSDFTLCWVFEHVKLRFII